MTRPPPGARMCTACPASGWSAPAYRRTATQAPVASAAVAATGSPPHSTAWRESRTSMIHTYDRTRYSYSCMEGFGWFWPLALSDPWLCTGAHVAFSLTVVAELPTPCPPTCRAIPDPLTRHTATVHQLSHSSTHARVSRDTLRHRSRAARALARRLLGSRRGLARRPHRRRRCRRREEVVGGCRREVVQIGLVERAADMPHVHLGWQLLECPTIVSR